MILVLIMMCFSVLQTLDAAMFTLGDKIEEGDRSESVKGGVLKVLMHYCTSIIGRPRWLIRYGCVTKLGFVFRSGRLFGFLLSQ